MRPRSDSVATRARLLDAAERLFAEQGIGAVSLRQINAASGARNVSAVHYHFGSKEAVIATLVERRMRELNQARLDALAAVERAAGDGTPDLRAMVEAVVRPGLGMATGKGASWIRFVARALADPTVSLERLAPPEHWEMLARFGALLRRALPELPDDVLTQRAVFCSQQLMAAVVGLERQHRDGRHTAVAHDRFVRALVDYAVGGLTAPITS